MNKNEYLDDLRAHLSQLPPEEADRAVTYYSELIDDMTEDGYTQSEAVASLDSPADAARHVLEELPLVTLVKSRARPERGWTATAIVLAIVGSPVWLSIALALFAAALSVYIVIWAVVAVLFAVAGGVGVASVASLFAPLFANYIYGIPPLSVTGLGIAGIGAAILLFIAAIASAKGSAKLSATIFLRIKRFFIKEEQ
ncbi:MAG: DUF1700 domain-containing protein [Oscillospiraceae bacterium]|nr:DUF1700 domain-containing protein [Oscillospiraceae bacterium]